MIPTRIFLDRTVTKITAEAPNGSFCLLPRHIDFATVLVPGLLSFETEEGEERFVAVDEGTLVKRGAEVLVATANAAGGADLEKLEQTVREQFSRKGEKEKQARIALAGIEASFARRILEAQRDRRG